MKKYFVGWVLDLKENQHLKLTKCQIYLKRLIYQNLNIYIMKKYNTYDIYRKIIQLSKNRK